MRLSLTCTAVLALSGAAVWIGCDMTAGTWRDCAAIGLIALGTTSGTLAAVGLALAWLFNADDCEPGGN